MYFNGRLSVDIHMGKKIPFLKIFKNHKTVIAIIYINANLKNSKFAVYVFPDTRIRSIDYNQ